MTTQRDSGFPPRAKVEPVWKVKHTVGQPAEKNMVPHSLFNKACDDVVAVTKQLVELEIAVKALLAAYEAKGDLSEPIVRLQHMADGWPAWQARQQDD